MGARVTPQRQIKGIGFLHLFHKKFKATQRTQSGFVLGFYVVPSTKWRWKIKNYRFGLGLSHGLRTRTRLSAKKGGKGAKHEALK